MAHQGTTRTHRRILAVPDPKPSIPIDPILKEKDSGLQKCSCSTNKSKSKHPTTQSSDPLIPSNKSFFMTNQSSKLNLNHKNPTFNSTHHYHPAPPRNRDIHLQAKAMTVSADYAAVSSKPSLIKPQAPHRIAKAKELLKEKVRKSSTDLDLDKKKEQQQHHQRSVVDSKKVIGLTVNKDKQVKNNVGDMEKGPVPGPGRGRRRKSFCGSQVELADILANCGVKIVSVDMPPFMQIHAVDCARKTHDSLENFTSKTLALTLKKEFDGVYGPAWHCIVGKSFGSFVTHSVGGFLYFSMDQKLHVLLFKTTVQRAD